MERDNGLALFRQGQRITIDLAGAWLARFRGRELFEMLQPLNETDVLPGTLRQMHCDLPPFASGQITEGMVH